MEFAGKGHRFFSTLQVRFGDNFEQWGAGPVEIKQRSICFASAGEFVAQFAVSSSKVGRRIGWFGGRIRFQFDGPADAEGQVVLADLVPWEIGIEVVLSVPLAEVGMSDPRRCRPSWRAHGFSVQNRKVRARPW